MTVTLVGEGKVRGDCAVWFGGCPAQASFAGRETRVEWVSEDGLTERMEEHVPFPLPLHGLVAP